jgi:SpoVK/Ycf46/Vps4 family AAA+-type ATPase
MKPSILIEVSTGGAFDDLDAMVGLASVKREVKEWIVRLQADQKLSDLILIGPRGCGKTNAARLIAKALGTLKLLRKGHLVEVERASLVAGYVGQTEVKTLERCNEALDGVLFVDDFNQLYPGSDGRDFGGHEAIGALFRFAEDNRDRIVVIAAAYPWNARGCLKAHPEFLDRFADVIEFPPPNVADLCELINRMAADRHLTLPGNLYEMLTPWLEAKSKEHHWLNGRSLLWLLEKAVWCRAERVSNDSHADLSRIEAADIARAIEICR